MPDAAAAVVVIDVVKVCTTAHHYSMKLCTHWTGRKKSNK
jgi:hypothetical protein